MIVILSPTVVRLLDDEDNSMLTIELNEEDNKEEGKKEIDEKDNFLYNLNFSIAEVLFERKDISTSYILGKYTNSIDVFLRPPKYFI